MAVRELVWILLILDVYGLVICEENKRILLKTDAYWQMAIANLTHDMVSTKAENVLLKQEIDLLRKSQGSSYIRWGRTVCGGNGAEKVYSGYTGSNWYSVTGGPANYICMPEDPTWAKYTDGNQAESNSVYGTEYEDNTPGQFNPFSSSMDDQDAPCVVCRVPRTTTIMIPARTICYTGWQMEYTGYLMTVARRYPSSSEYICVDADPQAVPGGAANHEGALLYFVESACGSLPCPPYVDGRELACVVCSK